jgi:hypothetical protein
LAFKDCHREDIQKRDFPNRKEELSSIFPSPPRPQELGLMTKGIPKH